MKQPKKINNYILELLTKAEKDFECRFMDTPHIANLVEFTGQLFLN